MLEGYDVMALQETWLVEGSERSVRWPDGFKAYVSSRPVRDDMRSVGGGVAVLVRDSLPHSQCPNLSWPDIMVLDFGTHYLVASYILPSTSDWQSWSDVDPMDRIEEVLSFCTASSKPTLWVGDLNARIGQSSPVRLPRTSQDSVVNSRGRDLLAFCEIQDLAIVNGSRFDSTTPKGNWTSFQSMGRAVVDYMVASSSMLPFITDFSNVDQPDHSDHALLSLTINVPVTRAQAPRPRRSKPSSEPKEFRLPPPRDPMTQELVPPSYLDNLLQQVIALRRTDDEMCGDIYGVCYSDANPVVVYTDGSCHNNGSSFAKAGAGVWWGENSPRNRAERVPGAQTNTRGELLAVLLAIQDADPRRKLVIYSDSEGVIRTYCYWVENFADQGWRCANADLIRYALFLCVPVSRLALTDGNWQTYCGPVGMSARSRGIPLGEGSQQ